MVQYFPARVREAHQVLEHNDWKPKSARSVVTYTSILLTDQRDRFEIAAPTMAQRCSILQQRRSYYQTSRRADAVGCLPVAVSRSKTVCLDTDVGVQVRGPGVWREETWGRARQGITARKKPWVAWTVVLTLSETVQTLVVALYTDGLITVANTRFKYEVSGGMIRPHGQDLRYIYGVQGILDWALSQGPWSVRNR